MNHLDLQKIITDTWDNIDKSQKISTDSIEAINKTIELLDSGELRVSNKIKEKWIVNTWLKQAVLLSFKTSKMKTIGGGPDNSMWWDKVPSKFSNWDEQTFSKAGFRSVPGSIVRHGSFVAADTVLMPSFINIGAYIDTGTMIDTWSTVGSCAQIGKNCHISGGVGIGGVLEPIQASPVIIEDNCFIGARSEVAEGVIVEEGSVISMGVYLGASTKIINRQTNEVYYGRVPKYSVVVPGSMESKKSTNADNTINLSCAVIVKQVDEKTRSKTSINELLRF